MNARDSDLWKQREMGGAELQGGGRARRRLVLPSRGSAAGRGVAASGISARRRCRRRISTARRHLPEADAHGEEALPGGGDRARRGQRGGARV